MPTEGEAWRILLRTMRRAARVFYNVDVDIGFIPLTLGNPGGCRLTTENHCDRPMVGCREQQQVLAATGIRCLLEGSGLTHPLLMIHGCDVADALLSLPSFSDDADTRWTPRFANAARSTESKYRRTVMLDNEVLRIIPENCRVVMAPQGGYTAWVASWKSPRLHANHAVDVLTCFLDSLNALKQRNKWIFGKIGDETTLLQEFGRRNIAAAWPPNEIHAGLMLDVARGFSTTPDPNSLLVFCCSNEHQLYRLPGEICYYNRGQNKCHSICTRAWTGGHEISRAAWDQHSNLFEYLLMSLDFSGALETDDLLEHALIDDMNHHFKSVASPDEQKTLCDGFLAGMKYWRENVIDRKTGAPIPVNDAAIRFAEFRCAVAVAKMPQNFRKYYKHGILAAGNLTALDRAIKAATTAAATASAV